MQQYRDIKSRHQDAILFFRMGDFYEMFFDDAELAPRSCSSITLTVARRRRSAGRRAGQGGGRVPPAADRRGAPRRHLRAGRGPEAGQGDRQARSDRDHHPRRGARGRLAGRRAEQLPGRGRLAGPRGSGAAGQSASRRSISPPANSCSRRSPVEALAEALEPPGAGGSGRARPMRELAARGRRPAHRRASAGSSTPSWPARSWRAASAWPRSTASASGPPTIPRSAPRAPCSATSPSCSPADCRTSPGPTVRRADAAPLARRDDPPQPRAGRAAARRRARRHPARDDRPHRDADGRAAAPRLAALSPLARSGARSSERLDAVDALRARTPAAAPGSARRSTACATSSAWPAARPPGRATPRELGALRDSFLRLPDVARGAARPGGRGPSSALSPPRRTSSTSWPTSRRAARPALERPAAGHLADGDVIRPGFDAELDELRDLRDGGKQYIAALQQRERERTGIPSLKVGYNKVFGYYLEVTHAHASRVPADYERRQTLTGAERYVTPELKEYEAKVLGAEERMADARGRAVRGAARPGRGRRRADPADRAAAGPARRLGRARRARGARTLRAARGHDGFDLALTASRHPVIERMMPREAFMPNDVALHRGGAGAAGDRPQHGRQEHHPAADRPLRRAGPDGRVRAGGRRARSAWWTGSSPGSARATTWRRGSPPSWWR